MRSLTLTMFFAVSIIVLGGATTAHAQLAPNDAIRFNVPYDFMVERASMPAGEYTITRMPGIRDPSKMLIMRGPDGKSILLNGIADESLNGYAATEMTLQRVDGRYYLAKIKIEGQFRGYEIPKSHNRRDYTARIVTIRQASPDSEF